jgi:hypothetical protein
MTVSPVKKSLALQLKRLNGVKNCTLTSEGVLSVNLWSGSAVHIHDWDSAPKTRQIKKVLQETSRLGIGSLFVVAAPLLPADGTRFEPTEWMLALHELSGERIYTYRLHNNQAVIGQVHLKLYGGNLRELWYGPDIVPAGLPFYRVWVKLPAIRGDWLVGNFGNELFWKQPDFRTQRAAEHAREEGARAHNWSSEQVYGAYSSRTNPILQEAKLDLAYQQLGLARNADEALVKMTFRKLARQCHPDVSHLPKEEAERRFRSINEAYSYIRSARGW